LAAALGGAVRCVHGVVDVHPNGGAWTLTLAGGHAIDADAVVLATAARAAAPLVRGFDARLADRLAAVDYAGLAMVALGYRAADVPRPLDGYGYLAAGAEGLTTLGVVWESSLFPHRAPDEHVLLRAMLGGSRRPEVVEWADDAVLAAARRELTAVLGVTAAPVHTTVQRWPAAIAQYTVGHRHRRAAMLADVQRHPGLTVCGTSYDGVSFNDAVKSGRLAARQLTDALWTTPPAARDAAAAGTIEAHV
jgi:oxygen-dependent protoporphyrinogen oxidase